MILILLAMEVSNVIKDKFQQQYGSWATVSRVPGFFAADLSPSFDMSTLC